jgi:hypothetical protein
MRAAGAIRRPFLIKATYPPTFLDKLPELREKKGFIAKGIARARAAEVVLFCLPAKAQH